MSTIMIIAAHPDDEVLGCGGTIAKHATQGDQVHILILAEGLTSRDKNRDISTRKEELGQLAQTAKTAGKLLGAHGVMLLGLPDNRLDTVPRLDLIKKIEAVISKIQPSIVYTHHGGDLNIDHRITCEAVITACRPYPGQAVRTLLFMEIPSSTGWQVPDTHITFNPTWFTDISARDKGTSFLEKKLNALRVYDSEMRAFPHARSIEAVKALARWRGASAGLNAAEAFVSGRQIH